MIIIPALQLCWTAWEELGDAASVHVVFQDPDQPRALPPPVPTTTVWYVLSTVA
jgi:hypothetical protein